MRRSDLFDQPQLTLSYTGHQIRFVIREEGRDIASYYLPNVKGNFSTDFEFGQTPEGEPKKGHVYAHKVGGKVLVIFSLPAGATAVEAKAKQKHEKVIEKRPQRKAARAAKRRVAAFV